MAADDGSASLNRKTHRSLAISDLIGLVAVFALAFSAKQGHVDLMLAPIVLAPVILIKRGRLRDFPRPAEWVMLAIASRTAPGLQPQRKPPESSLGRS